MIDYQKINSYIMDGYFMDENEELKKKIDLNLNF
jgi:hypothetical protein